MQRATHNEPRLDAAHYVAKRDGTPLAYLENCRREGREGLFLGPAHYRELWDAQLLEPGITSIRIMYGQGADEHYLVSDRDTVEGLEGAAHSGKSGTHRVEDVVPARDVKFEVYMHKR